MQVANWRQNGGGGGEGKIRKYQLGTKYSLNLMIGLGWTVRLLNLAERNCRGRQWKKELINYEILVIKLVDGIRSFL